MYRKVKLRGYFEHDKEFLLSQRTNLQLSDNTNISPFNRSGYHVLTPFVLENGRRVLVNRGWISEFRKKPESRQSGQIQGIVEFNAYVTFDEKVCEIFVIAKKNSILNNSIQQMDIVTIIRTMFCKYFYLYRSETLDNILNMEKLVEKLQIEPMAIFVADRESTHKMGPIGGQLSFENEMEFFQQYRKVFSYLMIAFVMYLIF